MRRFTRSFFSCLLLAALFFGLSMAVGAQGLNGPSTGGDAHSLSGSWFKDQAGLNENSSGYQRTLYDYFKYREADFGALNSFRSGSPVLKSIAVADNEKKRTAAVGALGVHSGLAIRDAVVTAAVLDSAVLNDLIRVTVYEWTFYDYSDSRGGGIQSDVAGFGTLHRLTLAADGTGYRLLSDAYDESDIDGFSTVVSETQPALLGAPPAYSAASSRFCTGYDPGAAARYADAHVWNGADMSATGVFESHYNPEYYNYNAVGGDCANFVSQCLYAGGMPQTAGESGGQSCWYFSAAEDRSDTWTRSTLLRRWLGSTWGLTVDSPKDSDILTGSPVFYSRSGGYTWNHATICVGVNSAGTPVVNSHNNDRYRVVWNYWPAGTTVSTVQLTYKTILFPSAPEPSGTDRLSIAAYSAPTALVTGSGYPVYGTVTSERSPVQSVTVGVYYLSGKAVTVSTVKSQTQTALLDSADDDLRFGMLKPGWYRYKVAAANAAGEKTLVDRIFLVNDGSGTKSDPYRIDSAEMLAGLSEAVNSGRDFKAEYFRLTADISLTGVNRKPIGTERNPFGGCFDGYGHAITGLQASSPPQLFGTTRDAVIKNLAADGYLAGTNGGAIVNCLTTVGSPAAVDSKAAFCSLVNCWYPGLGPTSAESLNGFVRDTAKNGAGQYFLWREGAGCPEFDPLRVSFTVPAGSGEPPITVSGLPYGATVAVPAPQLPAGITVASWYQGLSTVKAWDSSLPVTESLDLTASLKQERYTLRLDAAGGSTVNSPGQKAYGDRIALPVPVRQGYTFTGWYTSGGQKADWMTVPDLGEEARTVTLTAHWSAYRCELRLHADGAVNPYTGSAVATVGSSKLTVSELPEKADAGFAGYFTADGRQILDLYGNLIPGTELYTDTDGSWVYARTAVDLFARWSGGVYTVTYDTNYGSLPGLQEVTKNRRYTQSSSLSAPVNLPVPLRSGYAFKGWYKTGDFSGPVVRVLNARVNTVLYARWSPDNLTWENPYSDVHPGDWFFNAVKFVSQNGSMNGARESEFAPGAGMTAGAFIQALWRLDGSPMPAGSAVNTSVPQEQGYAPAVAWAAENGMTGGAGKGFVDPERLLTREDCVTLLYGYARGIGQTVATGDRAVLQTYIDAGELDGYAAEPFAWAVGTGLLAGTSEGKLSPREEVTRASAATLIMRLLQVAEHPSRAY